MGIFLACCGVAAALGGDCEHDWLTLSGDVATGTSNEVSTLAVFDDGSGEALYAGGFFETAGGQQVNGIARWDGQDWSPLIAPGGIGMSLAEVLVMEVFDDGSGDALYVGGNFAQAGGVAVNGIARWDGSDWTALAGPSGVGLNGPAKAMAVYNDGRGDALYVGGGFTQAGGQPASNLARWDGSEWEAVAEMDGDELNGEVNALAVYNDGGGSSLYAGGAFGRVGLEVFSNIARWNGEDWETLSTPDGTGVNGTVLDLAVFAGGGGTRLYAGGLFSRAGGIDVARVASWDGTFWRALEGAGGTGIGGSSGVSALTVYDDGAGADLYVGGEFQVAGGNPADNMARWDGDDWSAIIGSEGSGLNNYVQAMTEFSSEGRSGLFVAGFFSDAGGVAAENIAVWGCDGLLGSCSEDVTGNGTIDLDDLNLVLTNFGMETDEGDADGSGVVDLDDLNAVLTAFGTECP